MMVVTELRNQAPKRKKTKLEKNMSFSFLFFSDVREDISNTQKYQFMNDITLFADRNGFEAIYIPERHFNEFGSIYTNPAIVTAYLIPQTKNIRFRTAGITIPLHHPAEIVEWWAINDILSEGRIDLGFGSGWNKQDFILATENYQDRKKICSDQIPIIQKLWRGETVLFKGPDGHAIPIQVFPRPIQKELNIWLLVAQNDDAFIYAGKQGYNVFTMLYGINIEAMAKKIALYRKARKEAGHDKGIVTLMLHTLIYHDYSAVEKNVEQPFKAYISSSMDLHYKALLNQGAESHKLSREERETVLNFAYQRYFKVGGLFGTIDCGKKIIEQTIQADVDEIACLVDFGVDYEFVIKSLPYLQKLVSSYQ